MSLIKTGPIVESQHFKELSWKDKDGTLFQRKDMSDKDWYEYFFDPSLMSEDEKLQVAKYQYSRILQEEGLTLPDNVFIIGTVNMDDTTHQFSRKVIDRAMTIEMNGGRLADMYGGSRKLEYIDDEKELKEWQEACVQHYVTADEVLDAHPNEAGKIISVLPERLEEINKALKGTPFEVSYRVLNELTIMVGVMLDSKSEDDSFDNIVNQAINNILLMKILPRIEGDAEMFALSKDYKNKMGILYNDRLEWLLNLAPDIQKKQDDEVPDSEGDNSEIDKESENIHQQTARGKIQEMIYRLSNQEFTRFWP